MYYKVTKPIARKLFDNGEEIHLLPCKIPNSALMNDGPISPAIISKSGDKDQFNTAVNYFEYYNCNYETGYYAHYYIKKE